MYGIRFVKIENNNHSLNDSIKYVKSNHRLAVSIEHGAESIEGNTY